MEIKGNPFYKSLEGRENAAILTTHSIGLNDFLIRKNGSGGSCLIMGYGDGLMVDYFKKKFAKIFVVEGSKKLCDAARAEHIKDQNVKIENCYFENYLPPNKIDVVLANHVLEHVGDPIQVLGQCKKWLSKKGYGIFTVPNATSLHRRIGVEMKILKNIYSKTGNDKKIGHRRVYDQEKLKSDIKKAGLKIIQIGGYNLKLVSQKQMADWSVDLLKAIFQISLKCPIDICSNIYIVCNK